MGLGYTCIAENMKFACAELDGPFFGNIGFINCGNFLVWLGSDSSLAKLSLLEPPKMCGVLRGKTASLPCDAQHL